MNIIKIGKHVRIIRYPWRFGLGINIKKIYAGRTSFCIDLGSWTMSIDFYTSKKSKYQTIRKDGEI
jgi:hypothetical protein